uniref:Uncharacterized protein 1A9.240 n=1 Tax=Neurospora crassa TaxID=5141 RepID=Q9P744_NEUCS|nr:hypothetical protein [Neurospora crassa]
MYRGRNIPSKSTPSTDTQLTFPERHYSYECKASAAERPYIPRPSRTQQLFNPKLLPKLTSAVPPQDKEGVADEILAQKEAERAKKKELERDDESPSRDVSPRRSRSRSASVDSVSTISTRSPSPRPSRHSKSPPRRAHAQDFFEPSPKAPSARQRSVDSRDRYSSRRSESPVKHSSRKGSLPPRRRSPSPRRERGRERGRDSGRTRLSRRDYSVSESRSRSPARSPVRRDSRGENHRAGGYYRDREDGRGQPRYKSPSPQRPPKREPSPAPPPRERSLSPFSKRLALTQAMNKGR